MVSDHGVSATFRPFDGGAVWPSPGARDLSGRPAGFTGDSYAALSLPSHSCGRVAPCTSTRAGPRRQGSCVPSPPRWPCGAVPCSRHRARSTPAVSPSRTR
jgi:hypothetical protein